MNIIRDWVIVTVPRVGSHYLQERIFVHTDKALVLKYHEPIIQKWGYATSKFIDKEKHWWIGLDTDNLKVITVARDPKDLLISDIAMGINYELKSKKISLLEFKEQSEKYGFDEQRLKNRVNKYTDDYLKLESLSSIVIYYDDLVSFPFKVTCFIADRMGIEIITDQYQKTNLDKNEYLVSSKNIPEYDVATEIVNGLDLSNFYEAYNKIRSKCISL